jgi:hypothetical protein
VRLSQFANSRSGNEAAPIEETRAPGRPLGSVVEFAASGQHGQLECAVLVLATSRAAIHGGYQTCSFLMAVIRAVPRSAALTPSSGVVFDPREWPGFWPPLALAPQRRQRYGVVVDTATRPARSRIGREYSFESLWMTVLPARSADLARAAVSAR